MTKSPEAFRTISEVAEELDLPQHVLRFWETRFAQIKPMKRGGGRRYYRPDDVELLRGIRYLLYGEGYTIRGVQRILREQGPRAVSALARGRAVAEPPEPGFASPEDVSAFGADGDDRMGSEGHMEPVLADPPPAAAEDMPEMDVDRDDHDPDEGRAEENGVMSATRRFMGRFMPAAEEEHESAALSTNDVQRLQATLGELLECKRLLDQVR